MFEHHLVRWTPRTWLAGLAWLIGLVGWPVAAAAYESAPYQALGSNPLQESSARIDVQPRHQPFDLYGYIDERGVAHFATEPLDERYKLFQSGGGSFDTGRGVFVGTHAPAAAAGPVSPTRARLISLIDKSPDFKNARNALREASKRHALDYELLQALVVAESGFDARAVSPKGAMGLMQLMPATAERYGVQADKKRSMEDKLFDPRVNIAAGARYLRDLVALFGGQIDLALAAYNAGEGAVQRAGNRIPNYRETQNYVKTVLQLYAYLKPDALRTRGGTPGRVRMQLSGAAPLGGAAQRGNLPPVVPLP